MVEIENISKWFYVKKDIFHLLSRQKIIALDNINLSIKKEEILAILGPNGAGKTTLLKIICGLILQDKGKVKVKGSIGYLSGEIYGFYPQLTAKQNLEFFGILYNLSSSQIKERIKNYSQLLEIDDLNKPFWQYSTGTKHRLSLLRLLILNRDILIMDEPTKTLDPLSAEQFRFFLKKLKNDFKKTIIFATHSLEEAKEVATSLAIMNKGKILCFLPLKEIKDLKKLYKQTLTKCY
jgi:ABC-type multidrug transport system ATPase subunit